MRWVPRHLDCGKLSTKLGHEVLAEQVVEVLGWVDNIPEHMVIWVAADWVVKEASDIFKEAGPHVARAVGIVEAIGSQVAGDVHEKCIDIIG